MPRALARASRWMTPATISPSLVENSPKVFSCSASRSRCRMTWRAVVAAIRPNPSGVSSHSSSVSPSWVSVRASTRTRPVLRSMSMRACGWWPSVCLYAVSKAVSMASITVSKGMSLSRSIARSAAMSTFTSTPSPSRPAIMPDASSSSSFRSSAGGCLNSISTTAFATSA